MEGKILSLKDRRRQIDELDAQILQLINERAKIVLEIGKLKEKTKSSYYVPHREKEIVNRLKSLNKGPFPNDALERTYKEILSACRSLEKEISVAYLGPEGSFGHAASLKQFGSSVTYIPIQDQSDIFYEVESGRVDYGVVAIENSTYGIVSDTLDMFLNSNLQICAEILLPISHNLLANCQPEAITKIYSHRQAFAQCREWLKSSFKGVEQIPVSSTSEAAKVASEEKSAAAIASKLAAEIYNLKVLYEHIEDNKDNTTRFLVVGKYSGGRSGEDKTSVLFSVKDEVGALMKVLDRFFKHSLNLSKIESRPSRTKAWEYVFFVDIEGHIEDPEMVAALKEIEEVCLFVKVLGSYPKA